jgi:hypothetical protein
MLREGLEDWNRHKADMVANSMDSHVMLYDKGNNIRV